MNSPRLGPMDWARARSGRDDRVLQHHVEERPLRGGDVGNRRWCTTRPGPRRGPQPRRLVNRPGYTSGKFAMTAQSDAALAAAVTAHAAARAARAGPPRFHVRPIMATPRSAPQAVPNRRMGQAQLQACHQPRVASSLYWTNGCERPTVKASTVRRIAAQGPSRFHRDRGDGLPAARDARDAVATTADAATTRATQARNQPGSRRPKYRGELRSKVARRPDGAPFAASA